jgi:ABC-2 type transport system permease protein
MKTYLFTIRRLTLLLLRRYFRSRLAIFFSIFFPLIFLFVFGSLSKNGGDVSFKVAIINNSKTEFAQQLDKQVRELKVFEVQSDVSSLDDARERMKRSEIDAAIELPPDLGQLNAQNLPGGSLIVYYDENNVQGGQTIGSILGSVLNGVNVQLTKVEPPLKVETRSTAQEGLTSFDYLFPGLLGFSLIGLGIFGPVNMLPAEKKTGALTRLRVTPLRPAQFILAYMTSSLVTGVLSISVMFAVAVLVFDFNMVGNYLAFILFALIGAVSIFGIGVAVGGWAKDERQAAPLSNIVAFPMMFLSGTFFPRFLMPEWVQNISAYLPLTPVVDGMRLIMTENKGFADLLPQLGLMGLWIVVVYAIAFKVFRWE